MTVVRDFADEARKADSNRIYYTYIDWNAFLKPLFALPEYISNVEALLAPFNVNEIGPRIIMYYQNEGNVLKMWKKIEETQTKIDSVCNSIRDKLEKSTISMRMAAWEPAKPPTFSEMQASYLQLHKALKSKYQEATNSITRFASNYQAFLNDLISLEKSTAACVQVEWRSESLKRKRDECLTILRTKITCFQETQAEIKSCLDEVAGVLDVFNKECDCWAVSLNIYKQLPRLTTEEISYIIDIAQKQAQPSSNTRQKSKEETTTRPRKSQRGAPPGEKIYDSLSQRPATPIPGAKEKRYK